MRIAYLECFSGISGDMFLGALVDAGVSPRLLEETVSALGVGAKLEISRVMRSGISATKVDVWVDGEKDMPREEYWAKQDVALAPSAHAEHEHHAHAHEHDHEHSPEAAHGLHTEHTHRGLSEIRKIISAARISESAKKIAIAIFEALGTAEAKIHNLPMETVHFHEVGAVDAMVDIVCAAVGSEALGVDEIVCSPLNVGGGTGECQHGVLPVPAPATLDLLRNAPLYSSGIQAELVTPTGAAIVKTLAKRFASFPAMKVEATGYGAGTRELSGHANVLRLTVGEVKVDVPADPTQETISVLEANIDDLNPQVFAYVMDRLLEDGALDAFALPIQMKKSRPGLLLTVLCKPTDASRLSKLIFTETSTLGVRQREEKREILSRKWLTVTTRWGDVRMKIASMNGTVTNYAPEYEDCRMI